MYLPFRIGPRFTLVPVRTEPRELDNLYAIYEQDMCMGEVLAPNEDQALARFCKLRGYSAEAPLFAQLLKTYAQRVIDALSI